MDEVEREGHMDEVEGADDASRAADGHEQC
jgi:hypothetical protein